MGIFGPTRISLKELAGLCHRLGVQLASGVDLRRIWKHEVDGAHGSTREHYSDVRYAIDHGGPMADALAETGEFFPPLFRELVQVGEETGHLAEVLKRLADNYEHQITLRRQFRTQMTWPLTQLGLALLAIGLLIWVMGMLPVPKDILGFGLMGTSGLTVYLAILGAIGFGAYFTWRKIQNGVLWTRPIQQFIMRIPILSSPLNTLALSRLTWSLSLTLGAAMELRRALDLSLRSTHTWTYIEQIEPVWRSIRGGHELHEALALTRIFPARFIDAIAVGERSGNLSETMQRLSEQYQEEARGALALLTRLAAGLGWALMAGFIIYMIFRIFSFYTGVLTELSK